MKRFFPLGQSPFRLQARHALRGIRRLISSKVSPKFRSIQRDIGQPLHSTHSHILKAGEINPGITVEEFKSRRLRLAEKLSQTSQGVSQKTHVAIIPSAKTQYLSQDVPYTFRQNTDFLYLTGFQDADALLLLESTTGLLEHKAILFLQPQDPHWELWNGPRCRTGDAIEIFGIDEAHTIDKLPSYFKKKFGGDSFCVWYDYLPPTHFEFYELICEELLSTFENVSSLLPHLHEVRVIKSPAEIELMRKSSSVAAQAFLETIQHGFPDMSELEVGAKFEYECKRRGAERVAYPPVVASGDRANTLHYLTKTGVIQKGELVLMDAGCEFHGYASDITRTWPINGRFTEQQREVYEAVLMAQKACIELVRPGMSLNTIHYHAEMLMGHALQEIGVIQKGLSQLKLKEAVSQFFPHHVGHYLGMDTHDTPQVSRNQSLEPGMVVTIEPGLYFSAKRLDSPEKYKGIGIRIEDDVLVTDSGHEVLTELVPTDPNQLELLSAKD